MSNDVLTHIKDYPVDILEHRRVDKVELDGSAKLLTTSTGERFSAPALIVATGASWRKLNVPGEADYIGKGVAFCPHCDGPFYKGKHVAVVGGGYSGIDAAIDLAGICSKVTVLEFMDELKADQVLQEKAKSLPNVEVFLHSQSLEVLGNGDKVTGLRVKDRKTDAERVIEVFFPEGFMTGENVSQHFRNIPGENPLTVIRADLKKGSPVLSHRDYLGAIMGLGILKELTGEIIVSQDGADIIVMKEIAEFLLLNYMKAGRANLHLSEVSSEEIIYSAVGREKVFESVASLRLDNVVSAAFHVPRSRAAEMIAAGTVFLGGICEKKADRQVREGEKIVLRGKGKTVL